MFEPKLVFKDWKYHLKSAVWTFLTVFLPIVCVEFKDLNFEVVKASFIAGSFVAALRAFLRIIMEPLLSALWDTGKQLLASFALWVRTRKFR